MRKNFWKTVLLATLLAGSLDIIAALVNFYCRTGKDPAIVLRYIASAVFGSNAYSGGSKMAAYGLLLHFFIAFAWTILYFILYPRLKWLSRNLVISGIVYGIFIWTVMTFAIVPNSKASTGKLETGQAITGILILIAAIGIPLSIIAHRYYHKAASAQ